MIEIALVDDEEKVLWELREKVGRFFDRKSLPHRIRTFREGVDLLGCGDSFHLIFLDIQMEGLSGIETARRLRGRGEKGFIVFVTVLSEYVYDAFEVEASDYLLKPLDEVRFTRTMERICLNLRETPGRSLLIPSKGNSCRTVPFRDILYCEVINHRMEIHTRDEVFGCHFKMGELAAQLDSRFFLCHRSYLVNLDQVCGYEEGMARMSDGERIPVSRLRGREFSQAILRNMMREKNDE